MNKLIVNADDFGLCESVNRAIIDCYQAGAVTSTTLLVNGEASASAADLAAAHPALGVGLHFDLTSGQPSLPAAEVPSLTGADGRFPGMAAQIWRLTSGRARRRELEAELTAQIAACRQLGIDPTHIDSHHHLHAHPRVRAAINRVCPAAGIRKMRGYRRAGHSPKELLIGFAWHLPAGPRALKSPARLFGIGAMGNKELAALLKKELAAASGSLEFMCHPGYDDERLRQISGYNRPRQVELEALLADAFAGAVRSSGWRPATFRDL